MRQLLVTVSLADLDSGVVQEVMREPVVCDDGFSYERSAIGQWLQNNDTSFVTGEILPSKFLVPNKALNSRVQEIMELRTE